jgi:DNA-binding HxlR family transcriptional regulator
VIDRQLYNERPRRYRYSLTSKGQELTGIIEAMSSWGNKYSNN